MASLRDTQRAFAAALRSVPGQPAQGFAPSPGAALTLDVRPAANLDVYRNNGDWQFRNALGMSFPVLLRRVGDDYFRQLAHHYRQRFPSRSGDLHWVGRDFPGFLAEHLSDGDYAWLADLAALEWKREEASVAETRPPLGPEALAPFAVEELEQVGFTLQPSLRLGESCFPVVSVWLANQGDSAPPVDQSAGEERYMILSRSDGVETARLDKPRFSYLSALAAGAPLGEAMGCAGFDEAGLLDALRFTFAEGLVCGVHSAKR